MDTEKRIRREIANSNERRRMQSINAGFNSLRTMLPKHDGEKLSKAAILQHTAEYIDSLEQEKTRLLSQQHQLKRLISSIISGQQDVSDLAKHSLVKKIKTEHNSEFNSDSSDEGIHCNVSPVESFDNVDELKAELIEVRKAVDRERKLRMQLEDQVKTLETQLYPERVKEIAHSVQTKLNHGGRHHSSSLHASASETGSLDNSENENETAVASLVDDVIAETIEIESGSCPGSPISTTLGSHPTIVIQQSGSSTNGTSIGPIASHIIHLDTSTLRAVAAASSKTSGGKSAGQPAAIALPIEVPFMGSSIAVTTSPATVSSKGSNNATVHHSSNSSKNSSTGASTNTSNIQAGATSTSAGAKSAGTSASNVVTTRISSVIVSNTNSNNNGTSSGNNGKDSGKNATSNGNVSASSDGKSASVNNSNSTSNKSSTSTTSSSSTKSSKQQIASASSVTSSQTRHNLETIVEAIRHLEGDHMFKDDDSVAIEVEEEVEVPLTESETVYATTAERK